MVKPNTADELHAVIRDVGSYVPAGVTLEIEQLGPGQILDLATNLITLDESAELAALIECIRPSAQDTLAALHYRGFRLVRAPP